MSQESERVYTINLGKVLLSPDNQRAKRAINMIKEFATHHMKTEDIKIDEDVAHQIWSRGMRSPPRKIRVRMTKKEDNVVLVSRYEEGAEPTTSSAGPEESATESRVSASTIAAAAVAKTPTSDIKKDLTDMSDKGGDNPTAAGVADNDAAPDVAVSDEGLPDKGAADGASAEKDREKIGAVDDGEGQPGGEASAEKEKSGADSTPDAVAATDQEKHDSESGQEEK